MLRYLLTCLQKITFRFLRVSFFETFFKTHYYEMYPRREILTLLGNNSTRTQHSNNVKYNRIDKITPVYYLTTNTQPSQFTTEQHRLQTSFVICASHNATATQSLQSVPTSRPLPMCRHHACYITVVLLAGTLLLTLFSSMNVQKVFSSMSCQCSSIALKGRSVRGPAITGNSQPQMNSPQSASNM